MTQLEMGRLLRAGISGFVVGCRVSQEQLPVFGAMLRVPLTGDYQVYGLIYDIHIDDDGLVRQLVTAEQVQESVIADNRLNRNVPLEVSVAAVGYRENNRIFHLLPPHPPLSLDKIYLCSSQELREFTSTGRFGYFRHILRDSDLPVGEVLAAHLKQAHLAHTTAGDPEWVRNAMQELIILLRDDYTTLMTVLGALGDIF